MVNASASQPQLPLAELGAAALRTRALALREDLSEFPPGIRCPWPLARIFNELLKRSKRVAAEDPVLRSIRSLEEAAGDDGAGASSVTAVGTVRGLATQVALALEAHADS